MVRAIISKIQHHGMLKELFANSFWSIVGTFISKILLFLIWIFVAKILQAKLYGEFSIIRSTTMLFADFVGSSIGLAGTNYIAKYFPNDNVKVGKLIGIFNMFSFVFGIILFILSWGFSDVIALKMLNKPELTGYLKASSIVILVSSINNNQFGILRGFNRYKCISKINLLQIVCAFPVYYVCTYFYHLKGAVFAYIFYNVIVCVFARIELRKVLKEYQLKPSLNKCMLECKMVLTFVLPYITSGLLTAALSWYNETRLVSVPNGYVQMGYYSIINVILLIVIGVAFMVCIPFVSMMSKYRKSTDILLLEKLNILLPLQVALLISVPLILFPEIVNWVYGASYNIENIRQISNYMFFFVFLGVYRQAVARFVAVKEKTWLYLVDNGIFTLLSVGLFFYFYEYGVLGFVWGQTIAYVLVVLLFLPLYLRYKIMPYHVVKEPSFFLSFFLLIFTFLCSFGGLSFIVKFVICIVCLAINIYWCYKNYILKINRL